MDKKVNQSHLLLMVTFACTIWMYYIFHLSNVTIATFGTGIAISIFYLIKEGISQK